MSAGVGGGGILVPIFNIILGLSIKESTGLSQAVIASSGIGVALFSLTNSHPHFPSKPLVDFNLVLILTPALLLGISFGVLVNAVSPNWLVFAAILVVLSYMAQRTLRAAIALRNKEREAEALEALRWSAENAGNGSDCALDSGQTPFSTALNAMQQWSRPELPWMQIAQVLTLWVIFALLQLGKSRHGRCTIPYASFYAVQVAVALFATLYFVQRSLRSGTPTPGREGGGGETGETTLPSNRVPLLESIEEQQENGEGGEGNENEVGFPFSSSSLDKKRLTTAAGVAVGAGALAGLIGMGGGFLLNPLLLEIGIHPQVASATSALMVLFSSSSAALSFAVDGRLNIELAAVFGAVCCVAGFLGVTLLTKVVKKRGASVVVFLLAGVMTLGIVATLAFGGSQVFHEISTAGKFPGFQSFCKHHHHDLRDILW